MKLYDLVRRYGWEALAIVPTIPNPRPEGNIFFVDSGASDTLNANDGEHGNSWSQPFATLNYAISLCTADQGDVILIAPGHTEAITAAGTASGTTTGELVVDKAGISIIGIGTGTLRPTFTLGTLVGASLVIVAGATNVLIKNLRFIGDLEDLTNAITLSATSDGAIIEDCEFRDGGVSKEIIDMIELAAACDDVVIRNCRFFTTDAGTSTSAAIRCVGAADRLVVEDCLFSGDWNDEVLDLQTAVSVDVLIKDCLFRNIDASGIAGNFHSSTTGIIAHCGVVCSGAEDQAAWTSAAMGKIETYTTNTLANAGRLDPVIDS